MSYSGQTSRQRRISRSSDGAHQLKDESTPPEALCTTSALDKRPAIISVRKLPRILSYEQSINFGSLIASTVRLTFIEEFTLQSTFRLPDIQQITYTWRRQWMQNYFARTTLNTCVFYIMYFVQVFISCCVIPSDRQHETLQLYLLMFSLSVASFVGLG